MVRLCTEQGLPEPVFIVKETGTGSFTVQFFKDIYNEENLGKLGLNGRQIKAVLYVKKHGSITNMEYQEINGVSKATASRDLQQLVDKALMERMVTTGKGTCYFIKGPKGS